MRSARIYHNGWLAGILTQFDSRSYEFRYSDEWFANAARPAISLTLPKSKQTHRADHLFPFFFNMLAEGVNKNLQCRRLKIDENDYFGLLLVTATRDTIGAITVKPAEDE